MIYSFSSKTVSLQLFILKYLIKCITSAYFFIACSTLAVDRCYVGTSVMAAQRRKDDNVKTKRDDVVERVVHSRCHSTHLLECSPET